VFFSDWSQWEPCGEKGSSKCSGNQSSQSRENMGPDFQIPIDRTYLPYEWISCIPYELDWGRTIKSQHNIAANKPAYITPSSPGMSFCAMGFRCNSYNLICVRRVTPVIATPFRAIEHNSFFILWRWCRCIGVILLMLWVYGSHVEPGMNQSCITLFGKADRSQGMQLKKGC